MKGRVGSTGSGHRWVAGTLNASTSSALDMGVPLPRVVYTFAEQEWDRFFPQLLSINKYCLRMALEPGGRVQIPALSFGSCVTLGK